MDNFGDRMKGYEARSEMVLDLPIVVRIDGRGFSKFTRGMQKPFDHSMSSAMVATAAKLVEHTHAALGYVQSDEISLVLTRDFFGNRLQKITSVMAGLATAHFHEALRGLMGGYTKRAPHFDARTFSVPDMSEAANAVLWRIHDARKNAISMVAQAHFSHKELHGKSGPEKLQMLAQGGVSYDSYPETSRHGALVYRVTEKRFLTDEEYTRIPEAKRPPREQPFMRSRCDSKSAANADWASLMELLKTEESDDVEQAQS
jgi:tRNA(His) guanylyltransferase